MMATVTQVKLTCDVCGNANNVKTWTFGLDGKAYEIDLCQKDGNALGRVAARYIAKARKVTAGQRRRPHGGRPRFRAAAGATGVRQQTGIYVYGILPADIEVAAGIPGVGEHPGLLRDVRGVVTVRNESQDERVQARDQMRRELARGPATRGRVNRSVRSARRHSGG